MIIVRVQGGLGNQLFQYALYRNFEELGQEVRVDVTAYQDGREKRRLELDKLGLKVKRADRKELHSYYAENLVWPDKILRYILGRKKYIKEKGYDFNDNILKLRDGYLNGYWQSEKYFEAVGNKIKDSITFQNVNTDALVRHEQQMERHNSVSVHVRLGDYLERSKMYGNICTQEYYKKAFAYMMEHVDSPVFYVFSDEPEKVEGILKGYDYCMVKENVGSASYKDMYLMSRCKHHIIANSTFSWWGAWLGKKTNQIVLTPSKWNNFCKENEICRAGWRMI